MLPKAPADVAIESVTGDYNIGGGMIHAKALHGPRFMDRSRPVRAALFLHGGDMGSNHTLLERPARWLIARELFDQVILPDRRGSGGSSPLVQPLALDEQAEDLRRLLNKMAIPGPLTVIGVDIAGPVALTLAAMDERVQCVVLVASAPRHAELGTLANFLLHTGVLRPLLDWEIRRSIGQVEPKPVNFDPAYDASTPREMANLFRAALRSIPAERIDSLRYESEASLNAKTASVPDTLTLQIPVLQVIGETDEQWNIETETEITRRFPNFKRRTVPGAYIHKDVLFHAQKYYQVLFDFLKEECLLTK